MSVCLLKQSKTCFISKQPCPEGYRNRSIEQEFQEVTASTHLLLKSQSHWVLYVKRTAYLRICYLRLNSTLDNVTKSHKPDKVNNSFYKAYFLDKKNEEKRSNLSVAKGKLRRELRTSHYLVLDSKLIEITPKIAVDISRTQISSLLITGDTSSHLASCPNPF